MSQKSNSINIRSAKREDFIAFYGHPPRASVRAIVGETEAGNIVGIAGYYVAGTLAIVFSDNQENVSPKTIIRCARMLISLAKKAGLTMVASASTKGDSAVRHFGFEKAGDGLYYLA